MFYDKFMELCAERNVKPSPILKKLGLSSGNLKRWEAGANVNSDTLKNFQNIFKYLLTISLMNVLVLLILKRKFLMTQMYFARYIGYLSRTQII